MADKSFGVKELNLLNASGTPTVTSPNNLNLNANTVAISTSCTIGNNLTVTSTTTSANVNVTGIGTLTRAFATDLSVSGVTTITVPANANPHSSWDVVNNSASAYRFTGPGQDGAEDNPNIYLVRGQRYVFKMNASGHPFQIRVANAGAAYSDGVTNNGSQTGNVVFNVQHDAPAQLFYQCTSHGSMVGNIYIVGGPQVISGVVTATTFVGNLTGTASANAVLTGSTNNQLVTVTGANAITGEANLLFDGTDTLEMGTAAGGSGYDSNMKLRVGRGGDAQICVRNTGGDTNYGGLIFGDQSSSFGGGMQYHHNGNSLRFYTNNSSTEKLRINSSGYVGVKRSTPLANLHTTNNELAIGTNPTGAAAPNATYDGLVVDGEDASILNIRSSADGTLSYGRVAFSDDVRSRGYIDYRHRDSGNEFMNFAVAGSERLRIGTSGQIGIAGANYGTSGQVLMSQGSGSTVQWASPAYIIHDVWALSSNMTTGSSEAKVTTWSRANAYSATIGSAMSESSGIFTFPVTGIYKVVFDAYYQSSSSSRYIANRIYKVISATSTRIAQKLTSINQASSVWYQSDKVEAYFDVTNISTHKIEFTVSTENASTLGSGHSSSLIQTAAYFTKIGDT